MYMIMSVLHWIRQVQAPGPRLQALIPDPDTRHGPREPIKLHPELESRWVLHMGTLSASGFQCRQKRDQEG